MTELKPEDLEDEILRREDPVFSVPELARDLEPSDTKIRQVLEALELAGRVERKDVGARATAWWHVERVVGPPAEEVAETAPAPAAPQTARDGAQSDEREETVERVLSDWKPGRYPEEREPRRAAGQAALETLRSNGKMERSDFEDELLPQFDVEGQNPDTWWKKSVRAALNQAIEAGHVERHHGPPHTYEWINS